MVSLLLQAYGSVLEGTVWDVAYAGAASAGWRSVKQVYAPG